MGLLNGLNGLAGGVGTVVTTGLKESEQQDAAREEAMARASLLNRTPSADVVAPIADLAAQTKFTAPPTDSKTDVSSAAPPAGTIVGVPADLLPIYQKAAVRTGIPVSLLVAQGKQESNFRNDATSPTGAIGIAQILPSTAANPGYGLTPIDPAKLRDPVTAINFQADYMRARAGGPGADFSNPNTVRVALTGYNGNSDPQYVSKITGHMVRGY